MVCTVNLKCFVIYHLDWIEYSKAWFPYDRNDRSRNDRNDRKSGFHMRSFAIVAIIWKPGFSRRGRRPSCFIIQQIDNTCKCWLLPRACLTYIAHRISDTDIESIMTIFGQCYNFLNNKIQGLFFSRLS